jgi:Asp-tRNA(Asn)/Glu-tRNA(Gln) amidotransferase A subunit family amidase
MRAAVAKLFESFDVVVAPTRATVAYPADVDFENVYPGIGGGPSLIAAGNLCGLPALAMPNGFGENGLPTSLSLLGPAWSEARLAAVGAWYQGATDWHRRQPPDA